MKITRVFLFIALAFVLPTTWTVAHAGYANCPGCTFTVPRAGGYGVLAGTPTMAPNPPPMTAIRAILKTSTLYSDSYYSINPPFNQNMTSTMAPMVNIAPNTWGATITWYYYVGGFWTPDTEISLIVRRP